MGMCAASNAKNKINQMNSKIDRLIYNIEKNRRQMDLKNASIEQDIDEACNSMMAKLRKLQESLSSYTFE